MIEHKVGGHRDPRASVLRDVAGRDKVPRGGGKGSQRLGGAPASGMGRAACDSPEGGYAQRPVKEPACSQGTAGRPWCVCGVGAAREWKTEWAHSGRMQHLVTSETLGMSGRSELTWSDGEEDSGQ